MLVARHLGAAGRVGNQLWQVASTLGLARMHKTEPRFPEWAYQSFFSVPDEYFASDLVGKEASELLLYLDSRVRVYMQDYGLWRNVEAEVREWFTPSPTALEVLHEFKEFWALPRPVVSLHIRRGDNVPGKDPGTPDKHLYHPLRPMSYYQDALRMVEGASLAVFSDDIQWAEAHFQADYFHHGVARPKEHEPEYATAPVLDWIDLQLMTFCDRHVISNSTYSWWGAFLSEDPSPIYPWPWVGKKLRFVDASLMFPSSWTRFDHGAL